jgi:prepilin-type N-terminal cleavage/methylation domain-containing protein
MSTSSRGNRPARSFCRPVAATFAGGVRVRAFTLIELLIVLSIVGLLSALMAPAVGKLVDSAAAQEEWLTLERRLQDLAFRAYALGSPVEVRFKGAGLTWSSLNATETTSFEHLFFDDQTVLISRHGLASVERIKVVQRGRSRSLSLQQWNREDP